VRKDLGQGGEVWSGVSGGSGVVGISNTKRLEDPQKKKARTKKPGKKKKKKKKNTSPLEAGDRFWSSPRKSSRS